MKTLITILALSLSVGFASAQDLKDADVPADVKAGFAKEFPKAKAKKWEKEGNNYEAEYMIGKVENTAIFDAKGSLVATEVDIDPSTLPQAIKDYVTQNMKDKKIKEAAKISYKSGSINYEAEVDGVDYIFDDKGTLISKESDGDKKDD